MCEDIAEKLGTVGYMSDLNRIRVDNFLIDDAITFEELEKNKNNLTYIEEKLINMESIFKEFPKLILNKRKQELFLNGVMLTVDLEDGIYNIYSEEKYVGIGIVKEKLLKRDVII